MKIEHFAYQIENPAAVAAWYVAHLGFVVKRSLGAPTHTHFLADSTGSVMVEIYNNPAVQTPRYAEMHPLLLHLAFSSHDPAADRDRLVSTGATVFEDLTNTPAGDTLVMLRDPWGFAIQLVKRANPMIEEKDEG
jgi:uncharacterized glyoxalase superfamily protein PhnB